MLGPRLSNIQLLGVLASFVIGLGSDSSDAQDAPRDDGRNTVLMHYMPWYETPDVRGKWGPHWTGWQKQHDPSTTDKFGLPDIWSHYHPLIGPYDSADPDAVECQLQQMKLAGVDGVIADWYGIIDHYDYLPNHVATQVLFEQAGEVGMTFSVCFEDRTVQELVKAGKADEDNLGATLAKTFEWTHENWFTHAHYQRYKGRPLVLNFGPIFIKDPGPWREGFASLPERPAFFALHHLWRDVGADGGFTWVHTDAFYDEEGRDRGDDEIARRFAGLYERVSGDPEQVITSAVPGFHDVYTNSYSYLAHRGGETLKRHLRAAMASESPVVQLVTWNDYGEGTIIEPTHEFGYLFLEILQDTLRAEGGDLAFTHEDLRLPGRLYRARKSGAAASSTLDRIASMLNRGDTSSARRALDRISE
ncbi:MAG: glycoside hydrolase family 71/99-like protein [Planctomycetota bacterium]